MSAPHPLHVYESLDGDRASVRFKSKRDVYYSYCGPSGRDGVHFENTSGRDLLNIGDFRAIYPQHSATCDRCETLVYRGQRRGEKP